MPFLSPSDFSIPFDDARQREGEQLFAGGLVQMLEGSGGTFFEARIPFFRRHHQVWLEKKPTIVMHECTCPHLENTKTGCAHLWALMLAANARHEEEAAAAAPRPPLEPVYGLLARSPGVDFRVGLFARREGSDDALAPLPADADTLSRIDGEADRAVLRRLEAAAGGRRGLLEGGGFVKPAGPWPVSPETRRELLPLLLASSRFHLVEAGPQGLRDLGVLATDPAPPFELALGFEPAPGRPGRLRLTGFLARDDTLLVPRDALLVVADREPLVVLQNRLSAVEAFGAHEWLAFTARGKDAVVDAPEATGFLARLAAGGPLPRVRLPGSARLLPVETGEPAGRLTVVRDGGSLAAQVAYLYGPVEVSPESTARLLLAPGLDRQWLRDLAKEQDLAASLGTHEGLDADPSTLGRWLIERGRFEEIIADLLQAGWQVIADGKPFRRAGSPGLRLRSGVDWFELEGGIEFESAGEVPIDRLLRSWRAGHRFVDLGDGSRGLLPAAWMQRFERLQQLSEDAEGRFRFRRAQALLLEPLLEVTLRDASDRELGLIREGLQALTSSERLPAPAGFRGELRTYQERGLAWLRTLAARGFGGCLADDMGLGKTVQALALLLSIKEDPPPGWTGDTPALVVCPRSLLWNWREEARRFTPSLRICEHHGPDRATEAAALAGFDLVLTTYGTLQRDEELLAHVAFGVVILDEAQAIKNPRSRNAECARGLEARLRLSLTGTPIENHLRDLWSQMDFLNPGLLGPEQRFVETLGDREAGTSRAVLARALRPLILRRTKDEVVPELPPRLEQTLFAEMSEEQETLYAAIREEARQSIALKVQDEGFNRARFHVLEALLRLRQAACHPGLVDPARAEGASGKLDLLLEELEQVVDGGHKALVFSQFTTLLRLVIPRLEARGMPFAYLDGATRNREDLVRRFQDDPQCPLFLISLKAGGQGLNLTAADYVFILDPWWNPAVEAQAIDRTHRIGQTRPVFAYRLVARGTVEERILELQARKRALADAILAADDGPLAALTEDDLRLLFS